MGGKSSKVAPSQVVAARTSEPSPQLPRLPASEPAASNPAASDPAASEPTDSESPGSKPAASKPAASVHSKPAASKPAASEPAASGPAASKPATYEPAASELPATLELRPDEQGNPLELSVRQQQLIQLQNPGAARVVVKKLHGGFSGSLVLQTAAYDAAGRPGEPAVTKLDTAAALVEEIKKQDSISELLGHYAARILRRPLYLGARGDATGQYTDSMHAMDADAAVVLELAGACWVLPEFFGKVADEQHIIVPFKMHLKEALKSGIDSKNVEGVLDDLYSVGGPLQRLACKATFGDSATAKGGFVATVLEDICREVTRSMVPAQDAGHAAKDKSAYAVPATLLKAATGAGPLAPSGEVTKRKVFERSFVHECGEQVWGDAACAPLIALATELHAQLKDDVSWLAGWRPLRLLQHGDLNAGNVLIDARGAIWLIDFAETGAHEAFCDAAKLISVLLFEYLPCDNEEMHRRGCAVVDALIPSDGARPLWEQTSALPEQENEASLLLALSLATKVQHVACDLVASAICHANGRGGVTGADVHTAALWLPMLREALRCLRYRDLSVWQKRTAWHAVQRLSTALLEALPRMPVERPEQHAGEATTSLQFAEGQLLLLRKRGSDAEAGRLEGSPADKNVYEVKPDGLHGLLLAERAAVPGTVVEIEDMLHKVGDKLPDALAVQTMRERLVDRLAKRRQRAIDAIERKTAEKEQPAGVRSPPPSENVIQKEMDQILLEDEDWAATVLRETGVIEHRRYAPGQQLSVLDGDRWHDLAVLSVQEDGNHQLRRADSPDGAPERILGLHAFNHAPLELSEAAFQIQRGKHANRMSVMHASIRDALSGRPLTSLEQCVPIAITNGKRSPSHGTALASINHVGALCHWLHEAHGRQQLGERGTLAAVLLTAPPAAGKTCLVSQMVMHTLKTQTQPLVPLVIKVITLQSMLLMPEHKALFASKWNWADAYCCATLGEASPSYRFLRQALLARRALLLLDGMDEGGLGKAHIERHMQEVLIPQGHPMLLTSRPDSLVHEVYEGCTHLQLLPLTAEQQRSAIARRISGSAVTHLMEYVQKLPPDMDGNRLSGNPLMLNMLISIYESRDGGGMPSSLQKVYEMASGVMLGRLDLKVRGSATVDAEQLRRLLQEVALEVHLQQRRQISAETLFRVAKRLGAEGQRVCKVVAEQLANDRMPMLSVIEHEPLVVQFSHLSFQEFFASQAICAIETKREGLLEPWRWAPWWGNAVRLGADCGMPFGLGLLRGAGLEGANSLNLSGKLRAHSLAAIAAVSELIKATSVASGSLPTLALGNNHIGDEGAKALAAGVEASGSLATLDLRCNDIGDEGAKALAVGVAASGSLTFLNINENGIGAEGATALADGVAASGSLAQLALYDNNNIGDEGAKALAEAVGASASLTSLNLHSCGISDDGATALAAAVAASGSLARLDIGGNDIGYEGAMAIAEAVAVSGSLAELRLSNNEIRDAGAKAIADALAASGSLTMLHLFRNEIGDKGATALAAAVAASSSLKELVLSGNKVGNAGAKAIADAICANGSLTTLNINDNNIGVEGAKAIAEAVRARVSLALKKLVMPNGLAKHAELVTACQSKGVMLE